MSYQVLARKWRPKNFHELVGQDHVRKALVSALDNDRLHHAYLFTGTRGVGKTTIARIIAKCLNCETGVTSRPCGECSSCREIDEGRFVDLIEVDAASRTKVEDTRELLDNVQYAPSRGRYKVYLIDEVHMLSTHSFNALLKTLEEPPPHVKFLLATTDPQKLPVTVLSRCLQFNLKNMPPERVVEHLSNVLTQEQIPFEDAALWQLGRAADGSMRDALSLTDQAIAYGQGNIEAAQVSEMLGLVDQRHVGALIDHLVNRDARALLAEVVRLSEQAADFETILSDMALYLHRMAVAQVLPDAVDNALGDREQVLTQAARLTAEDVQLYYQIAIKSQEDLPLAPDARTGFEMALIRMIAFAPQGVPSEGGNPLPNQTAPMPEQASSGTGQAAPAPSAEAGIAPSGYDDRSKKKELADSSPADQPQNAPEPLPMTQGVYGTPEDNTSNPNSSVPEPQLVKFTPPAAGVQKPTDPVSQSPAPGIPVEDSPQGAEPQEAGSRVQSARASLGSGLRTVQFPSASADKISQASKNSTIPNQEANADHLTPHSRANTDTGPVPEKTPAAGNDIPPWEPVPAVSEPNPVAEPNLVVEPNPGAEPNPIVQEHQSPPADQPAQIPAQPSSEYQSMMPEPISETVKQAPALRDTALPEAAEAEITPLVGLCPKQLNTNQDWLQAFAHLPLKGLDRSLAKNAALMSREGDHLKFALKAVTENFLTPERQASWQASIQTLFNEALTIEISAFSTDLDTPEDYEAALKQRRQHQAEALFVRDPVIQGLQQSFDATVLSDSVEPLI